MVGMSENVPTVPKGGNKSMSRRTCELKIMNGDEVINLPCMICTKVREVKEMLAERCMVSVDAIEFFYRAGGYMTKQNDLHEIAPKTVVRGIKSFSPQAHVWHAPIGIIGTGYHGLKTAMTYMKDGNSNIVCFDRNNIVGGYCWITGANKTSKLQTEFGSFHVWWGPDMADSGKVYYPDCNNEWSIWPSKLEIQKHFHYAAETFGVLPHVRFRSNVVQIDIIGDKSAHDRRYKLGVTSLDDESSVPEAVDVSVIYSYPGSMTRNRIVDYPGEEVFDGHIGYGMNDDVPFDHLKGSRTAILGNGAFGVENIRTSCEYGCEKVFLITRRKNLASPRVPCWFVHQGPLPTPGRMVLKMFEPMYKLCGFGDPWSYWSVHASSDRQNARVIQNSRFGIGDVTFLAVACGKAEYVEDTVKRFTRHTVHLTKGRKLEGVTNIIKSLGLLGDFTTDRLHRMNKFVGTFCEGDWRRPLMIDATGMNAANFATFSTGIGTTGFVRNHKFLHDYPKEYYKIQGMGYLESLPVNKANLKDDKPCYVTNVDFSMNAGIVTEGMCPKLSQLSSSDPEYKHKMYHTAHPLNRFLQECKQSWDDYQEEWKRQGSDHEYVPYPYTREMIEGYFSEYSQALGWPVSPDGPPQDSEVVPSALAALGDAPTWATDAATVKGFEESVQADHAQWWSSQTGWVKVPGKKERKWGFDQ
eukprot:CAMPEP_0171283498 /NCGR_PEP_ID=MMETSP0790-20130122/67466_1 /TAXON_ID=2925 /ORGANISM="Alexandrium catenella, Strain OF101" /LENGTH=694 /DNA_ID=CAMNT_0011752789 /DNA_START=33 /DNA_END=2117 /DNA_ORIENTATION=-